jgi:hypothetical protein
MVIDMRMNLNESVASKAVGDPRVEKMIALAVRHDHTFPASARAKLGPKASDKDIAKLWGDTIDNGLANSDLGDLSRDGKFDQWLIRLYMNHINDYEDISGEGIPALGQWKALSIRNLLEPRHQDFNRFRSLQDLYTVVRSRPYQDILRKIADAERIVKMKRDKKDVVLVNNERFYCIIPLNYGSCYTFNNEEGVQASFCTGSSSGELWFKRYSTQGPIISVIDKENMNHADGKWQIHSASNQFVDAHQTNKYNPKTNAKEFGELFPGLMYQIVDSLKSHAKEIEDAAKEYVPDADWNVGQEIALLRNRFPGSFTKAESEGDDSGEAANNLL